MKSLFKIFIFVFAIGKLAEPFCAFALDLSPGDLIKASGPAVYLVAEDGKRLAFPNEPTYFSWYRDFSGVKIVSDADLASLALGGLITVRPGNMAKLETDSKIYAVSKGGKLRYLSTSNIAKTIFGSDWQKKIITVNDAFASSYSYGDQITDPSQYSASGEAAAAPDIITDRSVGAAPPPAAQTNPPPAAATGPSDKNILFVLFDPKRPIHPAFDKTIFERVVFGNAPSVADYYDRESQHKARLVNAGILGWYSAKLIPDPYFSDNPAYHTNDAFTTGAALRTAEALRDADKDFDFSRYDLNNDHKITPNELSIVVVIPQEGAPADDQVNVVAAETPSAMPLVADGETILGVGEAFVGTPLGERPEFGTIAHCLAQTVFGLQNLTATRSDKYSVGSFTLMSDPQSDLYLDPQSRINLGWLTPVTIPDDLDVSDQQLVSVGPSERVIKVNRDQPDGPGYGAEYFLIENREPDVYDYSLPDTGLAIWDVYYGTIELIRADKTTPVSDALALWHKRGGLFNANFHELHWASDGIRSGVALANVGDPGQIMNFTLEKKILDEYDLRPNLNPVEL
jgi:M6 family metalloprotease-like protein